MEFKNRKPIYQQIADYFCENILLNKWKENEKIPSVREIAILMEVNPNTAMRAFVELQEKDIIYNKRGIGYFVAEKGYLMALKFRKDEFVRNDLPELFNTMNILKLSFSDLENLYRENFNK